MPGATEFNTYQKALDGLDDLKDPAPEVIAGRLTEFGRILKGFVLPFLGVNALLIGSTLYRQSDANRSVQLAFLAVLVTGWLALLLTRASQPGWIDFGGFFSALLLPLLSLGNSGLIAALGFVTTAGFAIATVLRAIPERSSIIYVIYLPWIALVALPQASFRAAFELTTFVPMAALFLICRLRLAGGVSLAAATVVGYLEFDREGTGNGYLIALALACVILAVWYESRRAAAEQSSLRQFLGEGLIVALAWPAVIEPLGNTTVAWWIWAAAITSYEAIQLFREGLSRPTRACWIAISIAVCLSAELPGVAWFVPVIGILVVATGLHGLGRSQHTRFLSNLGLMLCIVAALAILLQNSRLPWVALTGILAYAVLMFIAFTPVESPTIRWFQGLIQPSWIAWVRRTGLVVLAQFLRVPIVGTVFQWIRLLFKWLSYIIAGETQISLSTVVFALAQAFGALIVSDQLVSLLYPNATPEQTLVIYAVVWVPWGLLISLRGRARRSLVYPLLGIAFTAVPTIFQFTSVHSKDQRTFALLAMITGLAIWLIGAATKLGTAANVNHSP